MDRVHLVSIAFKRLDGAHQASAVPAVCSSCYQQNNRRLNRGPRASMMRLQIKGAAMSIHKELFPILAACCDTRVLDEAQRKAGAGKSTRERAMIAIEFAKAKVARPDFPQRSDALDRFRAAARRPTASGGQPRP